MARRPYKRVDSRKKYKEIAGLIVEALGFFSVASIYTKSTGIIGYNFKKIILGLFGIFGYIVPIAFIILGILIIISYNKKVNGDKIFSLVTAIYSFIAMVHLTVINKLNMVSYKAFLMSSYEYGEKIGSGSGLFGGIIVYPLVILFGIIGTYILLVTFILIGILILTNLSLHDVSRNIGRKFVERVNENRKNRLFVEKLDNRHESEKSTEKKSLPEPAKNAIKNDELFNDVNVVDFTKPDDEVESLQVRKHDDTCDNKFETETLPEILPKNEDNDKNKIEPLNIDYQKKPGILKEYSFPPIDFLMSSSKKGGNKNKEDYTEKAKILVDTLSSFGITAKILQISRGPAITRYELQPAPGIKVSRIVNLSDDIALNLAASGVRIEAPIPGKAAIGVEVPNTNIAPVYLREVLESKDFSDHPSKVSFCLGKDIAGKNVIADISKMPHLLIAGATGSGKSVCINTLIISILYKSAPNEVKMIMIDPKVVELSCYNGIPHLLIPVVTDPKKAAGALNWAVQEMTSRYKLFADKGVRDMERFNEIAEQQGMEKIPQIIVIIDELSDLMMVAPNDVEDAICRLAQMARAAGIHLIIATQRPSVDVITGVIKANIPSRIAFAVSSQTDSRTILDMSGAEKLLGRGDMLYNPVGAAKPIRVQGSFVSEKEVEKIVGFIKEQNDVDYSEDIIDEIDHENESGKNNDEKNADELLPEAIETVIDNGQASISMLQRRLRVGYARAARLIDEMENRGIVSGFDGSKPRNVLITKEEFEQKYKSE